MNTVNSLITTIHGLESLFSTFNRKFYDGLLPAPVITVNSNPKRNKTRETFGWCTSWKAWKDTAGNKNHTPDESGCYEINICPEHLNRSFKEICTTLLHEMAHLYNLQHKIRDTSRSGSYHNMHFKKCAEGHGLIIEKTPSYGWTDTRLQPETEQFIDSMDPLPFPLFRINPMKKSISSNSRQSTRKYVCPVCLTIIRATKEVDVTCGKCRAAFIQETG